MLARSARITTADDYRAAVRRGARFAAPSTVTYLRKGSQSTPRFGFIVAKSVGVAVVRNRVRRRLKAICYGFAPTVVPGSEIVIRALPGAANCTFEELKREVSRSLTRAEVLS
ncbi:ribonuclease P protein component [Subtercola frigoramans]|uniref:ribonuclease P protein component n=1 Tax=Subtercola frigoramans TaxID=120298 RepID=UPI0019618631|nr:ribonuclease P protein component [Subtercola frigoramans]